MKSFALALGAGGARGLAHIAVFEALDGLGLEPVAIAGSSIGALAGAAYAAGMTGKALRHHVLGLAHNPTEVWRRLMVARAGKFGDLFGKDFSAAMRLDPEKLCEQFLPDSIPGEVRDGAGDAQFDHLREAKARDPRPAPAAQGRQLPPPRLLPGERDPAHRRADQGRAEAQAAGAAQRLTHDPPHVAPLPARGER